MLIKGILSKNVPLRIVCQLKVPVKIKIKTCVESVPQISSVSAYITQFKMPNTHLISFPGVSDTHVKFYFTQTFYIMRVYNYFSERNETQLIFISTFRLCRVALCFFQ